MAHRTRTKKKNQPRLNKLDYGSVYCENCHDTIVAGDQVGWWLVATAGGRKRWTACCPRMPLGERPGGIPDPMNPPIEGGENS
jgi:hypothetical protein